MRWKELVHPEVQQRYNLLIKDGVSEVKGKVELSGNEDIRSIAWQKSLLDKIPDSTFEDSKASYETKIEVLEHQNKNLKEELFYLRSAMIEIYEQN